MNRLHDLQGSARAAGHDDRADGVAQGDQGDQGEDNPASGSKVGRIIDLQRAAPSEPPNTGDPNRARPR
jgi:hypothetical protein